MTIFQKYFTVINARLIYAEMDRYVGGTPYKSAAQRRRCLFLNNRRNDAHRNEHRRRCRGACASTEVQRRMLHVTCYAPTFVGNVTHATCYMLRAHVCW